MSGLHSPADLAAAGLAAPQAVAGLEIVTARYAMAITPEIAGLIDPLDPRDPGGLGAAGVAQRPSARTAA
jgi:lysine 2,3-aminomutase